MDLYGEIAGRIGVEGGGGTVYDVLVKNSQETEYVSVVNPEDKKAYIDLTSYVRRNELTQEINTLENDIALEYVKNTFLTTNYYDKTDISEILGNYYNKTYIDENIKQFLPVRISKTDYDNLPSTDKLNPQKLFFVRDVVRELDPSYTYHTDSNETIIVRVKGNEVKWFFKGVSVSGTNTPVSSDLQQYAPSSASCVAYVDENNTPSTQSNPHDWLGIYQNTIRCWYYSYGGNISGTFYGMLDKDGGNSQNTEYSDPYVYLETISNEIYYMNEKWT